jgi:hypothetical protein
MSLGGNKVPLEVDLEIIQLLNKYTFQRLTSAGVVTCKKARKFMGKIVREKNCGYFESLDHAEKLVSY